MQTQTIHFVANSERPGQVKGTNCSKLTVVSAHEQIGDRKNMKHERAVVRTEADIPVGCPQEARADVLKMLQTRAAAEQRFLDRQTWAIPKNPWSSTMEIRMVTGQHVSSTRRWKLTTPGSCARVL